MQAYRETEYFAALAETNKQFLFSIIVVTVDHVGRRHLWRDEHDVRRRQPAAQGHRRAPHPRLLAAGRAGVVPARIAGHRPGRRRARAVPSAALAHGWQAASIISRNEPGSSKFVVLEMVVSGDIIAVGLALALAIGLIGGLVPSIWAMLVRPLESLR